MMAKLSRLQFLQFLKRLAAETYVVPAIEDLAPDVALVSCLSFA